KDLFQLSQKLPQAEQMLSYAKHGDFCKLEQHLDAHKATLNFNIKDFWAYPMIADEYIKHGQPPKALKNYLDTVRQFPVVLPEKKYDVKRVLDSKTGIIDRKNMQDKKMALHQEVNSFLTQSQ